MRIQNRYAEGCEEEIIALRSELAKAQAAAGQKRPRPETDPTPKVHAAKSRRIARKEVGEIKKNIAQRSIISCIDKSPGSARVKMGKFLLGPYFGNIHFEFGLDTGLTVLQTSYRNSVSVTPNHIPTHPSSSILGNFDRWLSGDTKNVTLQNGLGPEVSTNRRSWGGSLIKY